MPDLPKATARGRLFEAAAAAPQAGPAAAGIKEPSYSLVVRGLSKKNTCPDALQQLADDILSKRFRFFPPCDEFVEKVFYCLHVEGDMAILVFYSELMAELLFQVCRDETSSPFSIAGTRFTLERTYTASRQFQGNENHLVKAAGSLDASKFAYLSGVPGNWEDADRLEAHFKGILERDFSTKVVVSVHILPAAAYVEFTDRAAADRLLYKCEHDVNVVSVIDRDLVVCYGVKILPLSREPFQVPSGMTDVPLASEPNCEKTGTLERRRWEETEKPSNHEQRHWEGRQKGNNFDQQSRDRIKKPTNVQQQESPGGLRTKKTKVLGSPLAEKQRKQHSVRFELPDAGDGARKQQEVESLARVQQPTNVHRSASQPLARRAQNIQGNPVAVQRQAPVAVDRNSQGLSQVSVMLGGLKRERFDSQRVTKLLVANLRKHLSYSRESDLKFQVVWDDVANEARVILSSEDMADRLMGTYVRAPDDFTLETLKFWMFRPEGYRRPRATYRTGASSSIYKVLQLDGCRVRECAERQFRGALTEALEVALLNASVLEQGKPPFRDLLFKDGHCIAVFEEQVASALLRSKERLFVAGYVLKPYQPPAQSSVLVVNLPSETSNYDPTKLKKLLREALKKLTPERSVADCITKISWPASEERAQVFLQSDVAADALMSAYIKFTQDFCVPDLPLTLHRPPSYIWPGAAYRPKDMSDTGTCVLNFTGFPLTLDSKALAGAVNELVVRAVLSEGVLEEFVRAVKKFYWRNGTPVAEVTVDELVAEKLVAAKGLVLAESNVKFDRDNAPPPGVYYMPEPVARTGGWIEEDEEEGEVR